MPAEPAEVHDCIEEGVGLRDLLAPARVVVEEGKVVGLACTRMKLGAPDASGRPRPVPVDDSEVVLPADAIVPAIGQEPVLDFLEGLPLERNRDGTLLVDCDTRETSVPGLFAGGDVARGAASVIKAIADGGAVAREIGRRHGVEPEPEPRLEKHAARWTSSRRSRARCCRRGCPVLPVPERGGFAEVIQSLSPDAAAAEASRCLDCDDLCSLCVTVCPNRANHAYPTAALKLALPSRDRRRGRAVAGSRGRSRSTSGSRSSTLATSATSAATAPRSARPPARPTGASRVSGSTRTATGGQGSMRSACAARRAASPSRQDRRQDPPPGAPRRTSPSTGSKDSSPASRRVVGPPGKCKPTGALTEGEALDLSPCATLIALLAVEPAMPGAGSDVASPPEFLLIFEYR